MEEPSGKSDFCWLFPQGLCHQRTNISFRQETIVDQRVCGWVGVYASSLISYIVPSVPKTVMHRDEGSM